MFKLVVGAPLNIKIKENLIVEALKLKDEEGKFLEG